jgi:hypothetical protein
VHADRHTATVVGGGLSGMAAAFHLRRMGCAVQLIEAADQLGGEAGSAVIDGHVEDHSYHLFFPYYTNTFNLIEELGIGANFRDGHRFYQLRVGDYPAFRRYWSAPSRHMRLSDLRAGNLPIPEQFLFYYLVFDLVAQQYERSGRDESLSDFMRGRWYLTDGVKYEFTRVAKSSAIWVDEYSARSMRTALSFFMRTMHPLYRIALGSLEDAFVGPFRRRLELMGVRVRTGTRLVGMELEAGRVSALRLCGRGGAVREVVGSGEPGEGGHDVVLAIPHHSVTALDGSRELLEQSGLGAAGFPALRSEPLASLHLYFDNRIRDLPAEPIWLVDSPHELTLVDIARIRSGIPGSVLNFCLIPGELADADPEQAARAVVAEVKRYIPAVSWADVRHFVYQSHLDALFYINDTGSWDRRPDAATGLRNLWLAGDYVRSRIDISGMENAVTTGMLAADAIRAARGLAAVSLDIRYPREITVRQAAAARTLLTPVARVAKWAADRQARVRMGQHPDKLPSRSRWGRPG